ncbi:hypothetical protein NGR_b09570 (plasmid) [Sinorhizobium fredii NGR234]|uniref:Uncharacterized protein n=1 Tax=Sinorhizobium fredii (strain NBRC 101917 / NGR234) TaxID=394 RepID=C3KQQ5_SINFN|nr:hypothetical protein NGR_b09570 [Sinorhizobium fredii NGR234]
MSAVGNRGDNDRRRQLFPRGQRFVRAASTFSDSHVLIRD